ncbi:MAG: septum formation protein Maf [Firmicutes bacterium]|nr:septum formation protein Maf [Bacillota bacterium]
MIEPQKVILASASPRRRELLKKVFPTFEVQPTEVEEIVPKGMPARLQSEYLAMIKARPLAEQHPEALVIGSDTTVIVDDVVLGKPRDVEEAKAMLRLLSGRIHVVCTGVALFYEGRETRFTESTEVEFYPMTEEEIDAYVASGDPMDKAGAYGIQSSAGIFIKGIRGDYDTVMGLPAARIYQEIKTFLG